MTAQECGVCHDTESKYKCPHCELKYCSIKCFRLHKLIHGSDAQEYDPPAAAIAEQPAVPVKLEQTSQSTVAADPYTALQSHPQFQPLFTRYPKLKDQLQRVHQATINPYQQTSYGAQDEPASRQRIRDRVPGQWTQDKADDLAAKVLAGLAKKDEGVREFVDLVGEVFKADKGDG